MKVPKGQRFITAFLWNVSVIGHEAESLWKEVLEHTPNSTDLEFRAVRWRASDEQLGLRMSNCQGTALLPEGKEVIQSRLSTLPN